MILHQTSFRMEELDRNKLLKIAVPKAEMPNKYPNSFPPIIVFIQHFEMISTNLNFPLLHPHQ